MAVCSKGSVVEAPPSSLTVKCLLEEVMIY